VIEAENVFRAYIAEREEHVGDRDPHPKADLAQALATCPITALRDRTRAVQLAETAAHESPDRRQEWRALGIARLRAGDAVGALAALERGDVGVLPDLAYYRALACVSLRNRRAAAELLIEGDARRGRLKWASPYLMGLREEVKHALAQ
jgi:hypothetical protein